MIKVKGTFRRKKLTPNERAMRKAVATVAKELVKEIKGNVPRKTGALRFAVGSKMLKKGSSYKAVIGIKSKYLKTVKVVVKGRSTARNDKGQFLANEGKGTKTTIEKIPNKYAMKQELKYKFLESAISAGADRIRSAIKGEQIIEVS